MAKHRIIQFIRTIIYHSLVFSLFLSSACSVFTNYPRQFEPFRGEIQNGNFQSAELNLESKTHRGNNRLCYVLELASVQHLSGQYEKSISSFVVAEKIIKGFEDRAIISASQTGAEAASLILNEKTIPYQGEGFEKILLHTYQALNYLMIGNMEDARVEIRRAYDCQRFEEKRHYNQIQQLEKKAQQSNINTGQIQSAISKYYTDKSGSTTLNPYQNAFTLYLSSLVYQLNNEPNDAYIDMKKCYQLAPNCTAIYPKLVEYAVKSGFYEDVNDWKNKFGISPTDIPSKKTELIIIYQSGWAPVKRQIKIPLPVPPFFEGGVIFIAFPIYEPFPSSIEPLQVDIDGKYSSLTEIIFDTDATATRYLKDKVLRLAIKHAIRTTGKALLTREAYQEWGMAGTISMSIFNFITEQADLRSWLSLPKNIQIAHFYLLPGEHQISLGKNNMTSEMIKISTKKINLQTGDVAIINVRKVNGSSIAYLCIPNKHTTPIPF